MEFDRKGGFALETRYHAGRLMAGAAFRDPRQDLAL